MVGVALVSGASRGIGAALTKELVARGWTVIGACRCIPSGVESGTKLRYISLDVTDSASCRAATAALAAMGVKHIDLLVNNAGVISDQHPNDQLRTCDIDCDSRKIFEVNVLGVLRVTQALLPLVESRRGVIVNISSALGSVSNNTGSAAMGGAGVYRASKAALNQLTRSLASELGDSVLAVVSLCPGWVQTDMGNAGGRTANYSPQESASFIADFIGSINNSHSGGYFSAPNKGKRIPW